MTSKTIIIFGSSRRNGYTGQLVDEVAQWLDARVVDISDYNITPYNYDHANRDDDFLPLMREVVTYDQIILASPVYWYTMSAQLKTFVDRFSDLLRIAKPLGRQLRGKRSFVIATGGDTTPESSFEDCFKHSFNFLGMPYGGMLYCSSAGDSFVVTDWNAGISDFVKTVKEGDHE